MSTEYRAPMLLSLLTRRLPGARPEGTPSDGLLRIRARLSPQAHSVSPLSVSARRTALDRWDRPISTAAGPWVGWETSAAGLSLSSPRRPRPPRFRQFAYVGTLSAWLEQAERQIAVPARRKADATD